MPQIIAKLKNLQQTKVCEKKNEREIINYDTVVGDYINTKKTTFDFNFDLNQAIKQHGYT